jgi:uncharacterized protein YegP (UPF0339 family)
VAESKLEYYEDKAGEWRWRRKAGNGEIIGASSEGYKSKTDCEANATRDTSKDKWEFYQDDAGGHRWRCIASNGKQVGKASEAFSSKKNCEHNAGLNGWKG